ncbi:MAG TPA: DUF6259 domain-containing protein [Rhodothermales bacterium]|nr:DUF6259 domain-containing protein [Rhodothermales bacterium]
MRLLLRLPNQVSEPVFLDHLAGSEVLTNELTLTFADESRRFKARLALSAAVDGIRFSITAEGPSPIWMVEWSLPDLRLQEVIIPALGGQVLDSNMPHGEQLSFKYPFWWNAQFVLGKSADFDGGVGLRTLDPKPTFKMLRVRKGSGDRFDLALGIEADAPLRTGRIEGEWFLDVYAGSWENPVDHHRNWMESTFGLVPYAAHPHFPRWAHDINLVLEFWGMRKDAGRPAHTFEEIEDRIASFSKRHPPENTMLYLPGYAEGGIDSRIPSYDPSEGLGGAAAFKSLVDRAHDLGYRVMIHTNVLGMAYSHPLYEKFERYQVVDVFGRRQGWAMDIDGDWLTEPYFAYMNPGERAWTELMTRTLGALIESFGLDAVFLDQTLLAFNVSRGPNFVQGMRRHVEALQAAYPNVLFAGEGLNDIVQPALPVAQIHGIDSVAGVHGIDDRHVWRRAHPVSTRLFGKSTLFVGHLLTKHPSHPIFEDQEAAYRALGVIPALVCYDATQGLDLPEVEAVLERARALKRLETTAT